MMPASMLPRFVAFAAVALTTAYLEHLGMPMAPAVLSGVAAGIVVLTVWSVVVARRGRNG